MDLPRLIRAVTCVASARYILIDRIIAKIPRFYERCAKYLAEHPDFFAEHDKKSLFHDS